MLGIIIGVSAVIALMSIGRGAQAQVTAQIQSLGTNLLFIRPGASKDSGVRSTAGTSPTLTLEDSDAIANLPNVIATAPELGTFAQMLANGQNTNSRVTGVTEDYGTVRNTPVASESVMDSTVNDIGDLLRARHKVAQDDFTVQSQQDFLNTFNQIAGTFTLLLGAIAGISLVVGGIGIMNIMLVSVTERTREIGIRKAVGARRPDILTQFLFQALSVSFLC